MIQFEQIINKVNKMFINLFFSSFETVRLSFNFNLIGMGASR